MQSSPAEILNQSDRWIYVNSASTCSCCTYFVCLNSEIIIELPSIAFNFSAHISANASCKKILNTCGDIPILSALDHRLQTHPPNIPVQTKGPTMHCRAKGHVPQLWRVSPTVLKREQRCGSQALGNVRDSTSKNLYHMI